MKTLKHLERVKKLTAEQRQRLALRLEQRQAADGNGQRLLAYLVARPGVPTSEEEIRDFAGKKMPEYMVPSAFVFLEGLPLLPNGKVDRKALPMLAQNRPPTKSGLVEPRNEVEEKVAGIWAAVLGAEKVGIYDNFFQLGGHSLLALQVMARLREAFQTEVPLRRLFETPTVAGLAEAVAQCKSGGAIAPIRRLNRPAFAGTSLDLGQDPVLPRFQNGDTLAMEEPKGD